MSDLGSNNSLYKSAPASSSEGDFHDDDNGLDDDLQRPNYLPGSSESSLIQVRFGHLGSSVLLRPKIRNCTTYSIILPTYCYLFLLISSDLYG